ncbi:MAG: hypothetical protein JJU12_03975 [Chlamydiales bacterium]|nr:hypothetical protein [Chlamydiales bacterium]
MNLKLSTLALCIALSLCGTGFCRVKADPNKMTSINIIDRNGMSETISSKERLSAFEKTDFLSPQPYQKVLRVFGRNKKGDVRSCITSYHPNGQPKQYLDALNNRAFGGYREWFPNGQLKIDAWVIGGNADLNTSAEQSWLFEGRNRVWNEDGILIAEIPYYRGELHGQALYYHDNGSVWKVTPYYNGLLHGTQQIFLDNGTPFQTVDYRSGKKEGFSVRYWGSMQVAYQEEYTDDLLMEAQYFDAYGRKVSEIRGGKGVRAVFGKNELQELQEYENGIQEGEVRVFDELEQLIRVYHVKNSVKHGEEIDYFPNTTQTKLLLSWNDGVLQGCIKTWYENGNPESQREISANKKNGLLTGWYRNGALMLVEEYDNDKLLKGEYYRLGESVPVSKIERGSGIATLFTPEGTFSRKVYYQDGKPIE